MCINTTVSTNRLSIYKMDGAVEMAFSLADIRLRSGHAGTIFKAAALRGYPVVSASVGVGVGGRVERVWGCD